jgi:hypothetical protein
VDLLVALLIFAILAAAAALVTAPLRHGRVDAEDARIEGRREELEAAKEAKYREIRDAEMDFRTGKLSEADFRAIDRQLRGEAVELLRELDELD